MVDKVEETIKAIAVKHGIAVGRDDPIMILQTINDRLMEESVASQKEILNRFKEELEEISHRWGEDAKDKAEKTLRTALKASQEVMEKKMQEVAQEVARAVKDEIDAGGQRDSRSGSRIAYSGDHEYDCCGYDTVCSGFGFVDDIEALTLVVVLTLMINLIREFLANNIFMKPCKHVGLFGSIKNI
jgi:ElaB/YqjD/DUF883 family membrane-anchored ribosome-binding protein